MSHSTIETFRKRYHKDATLRLLSLNSDGQSLSLSAELSKGFYIGREYDSAVGAYTSMLTIDTALDAATEDDVLNAAYLDLVQPGGEFQRFKFQSDTPPQQTETRFVASIMAAFNDAKPITGVVVYSPTPPDPYHYAVFVRYVHTQVSALSTWIVNHNLGTIPVVQVYDSVGNVIQAQITHTSPNQVQISFSAPQAGYAQCI